MDKLWLNEADSDMREIKNAYYQEQDMFRLNQNLADMVLEGRKVMPVILEQLLSILQMDKMSVFWGKNERELVCAYPSAQSQDECREIFPENENYLRHFKDDMLLLTTI